jgi:hypothetical protein
MRIMWNSLGAASCLAIALTAGHASAAILAYDGFTYTTGDLTGENGGSGWGGAYTDSGNSTVADAAGLAGGLLVTSPGSVRTADGGTATTLNFRSLGTVLGDDETETWVSFLARRNGNTSTALFAGVSFYNSNGNAAADGEISFAPFNGGNPYAWRILDLGITQSTNSTATVAPDVTDLIVARIVWNAPDASIGGPFSPGNDAVYLFVNPDLGMGTPLTSQASAARNAAITNIDKVRIAGQNGVDFSFDELRLGSNYDDVTPTIPPNADFVAPAGVGLEDFEALRSNYLTGTTTAQGDANLDGKVNHVDFFFWRTAYLAGGGSLEGVSLAIPEPSSATVAGLLGLLTYGTGLARRRR